MVFCASPGRSFRASDFATRVEEPIAASRVRYAKRRIPEILHIAHEWTVNTTVACEIGGSDTLVPIFARLTGESLFRLAGDEPMVAGHGGGRVGFPDCTELSFRRLCT